MTIELSQFPKPAQPAPPVQYDERGPVGTGDYARDVAAGLVDSR